MTRDYYQTHRSEISQKRREYRAKMLADPRWKILEQARKDIHRAQESMAAHYRIINRIRSRIKSLTYKKERLELILGHERAVRKGKAAKAAGSAL